MDKEKYYLEDIIESECNLEPLHCKECDSDEVMYHQYIGDAHCENCGQWQSELDC